MWLTFHFSLYRSTHSNLNTWSIYLYLLLTCLSSLCSLKLDLSSNVIYGLFSSALHYTPLCYLLISSHLSVWCVCVGGGLKDDVRWFFPLLSTLCFEPGSLVEPGALPILASPLSQLAWGSLLSGLYEGVWISSCSLETGYMSLRGCILLLSSVAVGKCGVMCNSLSSNSMFLSNPFLCQICILYTALKCFLCHTSIIQLCVF